MFKLPLIDCFLDLDQITTLSQLILQIVGNLLIPLVPSVTVNILLLTFAVPFVVLISDFTVSRTFCLRLDVTLFESLVFFGS